MKNDGGERATMKRTFTIYHGLAVSFALHALVASPLALGFVSFSSAESPPLVLDLEGVMSDRQLEEFEGAAPPPVEAAQAVQTPSPPTPTPTPTPEESDVADPESEPPTPPSQSASSSSPSASPMPQPVVDQPRQDAETNTRKQEELQQTLRWQRNLGNRLKSKLVKPRSGHAATAKVTFVVMTDGQVRPGSLQITASSGQPSLDESALRTVRASTPFEPPTTERRVTVELDFAPTR